MPIQLAFFAESDEDFSLSNTIVDLFFILDIILTFFTVYVDKDLEEVEDLGLIAFDYFKGWIYIDVLSVIPFERFVGPDAS